MNDLTQYNTVKASLLPGDIVMFWGKGLLSHAIELASDGPSHCAIVRQPLTMGSDATIVESTIDGKLNGVQTHPLGSRVENYDAGAAIAVLRLSAAARAKLNLFRFYGFIGAAEGHVRYDTPDLVEFLLRDVPILGARLAQGEHKAEMVCSSWVTAVLEKCGVLSNINWTQAMPQQIVEMALYEDWVPLLGNPKLKRFNTI